MKAALITEEQIKAIEDALEDMLSGWKYIRESHGDLYGIGWDRAESKAVKALTIVRSLKVQEPVAWITRRTGDGGVVISGYETCEPTDYDAIPVYTAPTKREWQALAQPEQEPVAWTQVSDALPKSGVPVLACYKNRLGNLRRIRACWVAAKTEEASLDYGECYEYDEETDEYYLPEGWYECMDNWDEYSSVAVCEGEITHWMPLPPAPDEQITAPPSKPWVSLNKEEFDFIYSQHDEYDDFAKAIDAKLKEKNGFV